MQDVQGKLLVGDNQHCWIEQILTKDNSHFSNYGGCLGLILKSSEYAVARYVLSCLFHLTYSGNLAQGFQQFKGTRFFQDHLVYICELCLPKWKLKKRYNQEYQTRTIQRTGQFFNNKAKQIYVSGRIFLLDPVLLYARSPSLLKLQ